MSYTYDRAIRKVAAARPEFKILNVTVDLEVTEDTMEHGAVGGPDDRTIFSNHRLGDFKDVRSMLKAVGRHVGANLDRDLGAWSAIEPGRITTNYASDENGDELDAREMKEFTEGKRRAWLADVNVYFQFGRVYTPDEREIAKTLGVSEY
jgi:hypothetical protein